MVWISVEFSWYKTSRYPKKCIKCVHVERYKHRYIFLSYNEHCIAKVKYYNESLKTVLYCNVDFPRSWYSNVKGKCILLT